MSDTHEHVAAALAGRDAIGRELGRGGTATVFAARDEATGHEVAVKVLHRDLTVALGPARFKREIEIASSLEFAHVTVGSGIGPVELRPNGVISYNTASGQAPVPLNASWASGRPLSFELLVDVSNKAATLLVNGNAVVSNAGFLVARATLNGISFNMGGTSAQMLSYDSASIAPVASVLR